MAHSGARVRDFSEDSTRILTALALLTAVVTMLGIVLAPPASAHHKTNHRGGPPPHANAGGNGQGAGPYQGQTCQDAGPGQGHAQRPNGNGYGHCGNEGNPGHGGTAPGRGRSAFTGAESVAPCSTVVVADSGWQPGAPVQLGGGFDGSGCGVQAAAQPVSAAAAGTAIQSVTDPAPIAPPVDSVATSSPGPIRVVADEVGNVYAEVTVPADVAPGEARTLVLEGTDSTGVARSDAYLYEIIPTVVTNTQASATALPSDANFLIGMVMVGATMLALGGMRMARRLRAG